MSATEVQETRPQSDGNEPWKRIGPIKERVDRVAAYVANRPEAVRVGRQWSALKEKSTSFARVATTVESYAGHEQRMKVLETVDSGLDYILATIESRIGMRTDEGVAKAKSELLKRREEYLAKMEQALAKAKQVASQRLPEGTVAELESRIAEARKALPKDSKEVLERVNQAWEVLKSSHPTVGTTLTQTEPYINRAKASALAALDRLHSNPTYMQYVQPSVERARGVASSLASSLVSQAREEGAATGEKEAQPSTSS